MRHVTYGMSAVLAVLLLLAAQTVALADMEHIYPTEEQIQAMAAVTEPEAVEGFLPVCMGCDTDRMVVAFTIDDCNQPDNLKKIIAMFRKYDGKATIFPIGENVEMNKDVLKSAWEQGFEIENHTWSHSGLYPDDDDELARQIWSQNYAVSQALGVNYQMHFLRPRGGDNRYDQRTHAYMRQMGYYGLAYWNHVGVLNPTKISPSSVRPGDIILFHTTDKDIEQLNELVPALAERGFRFVTLNELYGLPENETMLLEEDLTVEPLHPWVRFPQTYHPEDYLHDVYLIQERLTELGFLNSPYNGYYGQKTMAAVRAFQKSRGMTADGIVGKDTWRALFEE